MSDEVPEIPAAWRTEEVRVRQALFKAKVECDFKLQWRPFVRSGFDGDQVLEARCLVCNVSVPIHDEESQFSNREVSLEPYIQHALKEHKESASREVSRKLRFFQISVPSSRSVDGVVWYKLQVSAWLSVGGKHKKLDWIVERRFREFVHLKKVLAKRDIRIEEIQLSKTIRYGLTKLKAKQSIIEKRRQVIDHYTSTLARRACEDTDYLAFIGCGQLGDVIENPSLTIHHPTTKTSHKYNRHRKGKKKKKRRQRSPGFFAILWWCVSNSATDNVDDSSDDDDGLPPTGDLRTQPLSRPISSMTEHRFSTLTVSSDLARSSLDSPTTTLSKG